MNSSTTVPIDHPAAGVIAHSTHSATRAPAPRRSRVKTILFASLGLLVIGGAAYVSLDTSPTAGKVRSTLESLKAKVVGPSVSRPAKDVPVEPSQSTQPFTGLVKVTAVEREAIGFRILTVANQTQPIQLELPGRTDYDQNTLTKIRPRFDKALVEKVYVAVGQSVKKGAPLYDVRSGQLGTARTDCRRGYAQWDHDRKYMNSREPLAREGRITQKEWVDTQNEEKKSRLDYLNARDVLGTYEIPNDQIDKLLEGLGDDKKKALEADDNTQDNTRMTVLSKHDGVIVEYDSNNRVVVAGNVYGVDDVLFTISPMDKLWVWGDVFESDQDKVHIGQKCNIAIKYSNEEFEGQVESIAKGVDVETRTLRLRVSIPNPGSNLFARMLAKVTLHIKPLPTDTVIPRNAVVVINGDFYAFVEVADDGKKVDLFERRKLETEQEDHDIVIVKSGLKPGDRVVSNGSLILAQMYEDQSTVASGMPRP